MKSTQTLRMSLLLFIIMTITLACGASLGSQKEVAPTPVEEKTPTVIEEQSTPKNAPEPAAMPTETLIETPAVADSSNDQVEQPTEAWRVVPMTDAKLYASDQMSNPDPNIVSAMDFQARNLAIPKPYYYEFYILSSGATFENVKDHYNSILTGLGMRKALDEEGIKGISVVTWTHPSVKNRKYLVQFNPADPSNGQNYPIMFILYSNPPKE